MFIYMCIYIYIYVCICVYIYIYIYTHTPLSRTHTRTPLYSTPAARQHSKKENTISHTHIRKYARIYQYEYFNTPISF